MINRENYLLIKEFCAYLESITHIRPRSAERYQAYLRYLLVWADAHPFGEALSIRPSFSTFLTHRVHQASAEPLSPVTLKKVIQITRRFFNWLQQQRQPHAYKAITPIWLESLRLPRLPEHMKEHVYVSLPEVLTLTQLPVPEHDLALRRDQAGAALLFLSGMRVGALGTLPLAAVNLVAGTIRQWPTLGVQTKNSKAATTYLLPIAELRAVVQRWDDFVRTQLPATAMWFTPIAHTWGDQALSANAPGQHRPTAIHKRLRRLFRLANLPPRSPHKFRHGHAVWALQHARTMADYKAISQNLMHSDIRITDGIYANLLSDEVQTRVAGLGVAPAGASPPVGGDLADFLQRLPPTDIPAALHLLAERLAR